VITLSHGGGGRDTSRLIEKMFLPAFANPYVQVLHDGVVLPVPSDAIAFTTDSYVIDPLFFPGGDIGKLAVTGTVNDLAMCGARPLYMSCSFILEEGLLQSDLQRVVSSMKAEAVAQSLSIVTGDTKVIERRSGGGLFITTSGIGISMVSYPIDPLQIEPNDMILLSGDIGRHGMAIMALREGLSFTSPLASDCASLVPTVQALVEAQIRLHCLRDLTRGGLATALIELAEASRLEFVVAEEAIAVSGQVKSACEMLGIDPLYVANEGRCIALVPESHAEKALQIMQELSHDSNAAIIGRVTANTSTPGVRIKNEFGTHRYLYKLSGDQLPRIC
jgi:hydrogenase expression/formation protein HypE